MILIHSYEKTKGTYLFDKDNNKVFAIVVCPLCCEDIEIDSKYRVNKIGEIKPSITHYCGYTEECSLDNWNK